MTHMARQKASASLYGVLVTAEARGKAFAKLITEARHRRGMRQEDLVAASGVSRRTISRWEQGDATRTDPDRVRAVCLALGVDPRLAAVALGFLSADDIADTPIRPQQDPTIDEVIEILQDPDVPDAQKAEWIAYLRYLRDQRRKDQRAV